MLGVPKQVLRDPGRDATTVALWISAPAKAAWHVTTRNKGINMRSWESWSMANIAISVATVGHDGPALPGKAALSYQQGGSGYLGVKCPQ